MAEPVVAPEEPTAEAVDDAVPDVTDAMSETSASETTEEQPGEDVAEEASASEQSVPPAAEDAPAEKSEATMPPDVPTAPEPISEAVTEEPEAEEVESPTDVAQPVDASRDVAADESTPVVESPTDVPAEEDEAGPTAPEEETQADETPKETQMADDPASAKPSGDDEAPVTRDVAEIGEDTETEHTTDAPAEEIPVLSQPDMASAGGFSFHGRCKFHILIAIVLGSVQFDSNSESKIVVRALNLLRPLFQVRQKNQRW